MNASRGPFRHRMPVRFADVDHAGIVYYPVFFHYFHVCFEEFFRARLGPKAYVELLDVERIGFPAVRTECDYRSPLKFADEVEIELSLVRLGARSLTLRYRALRLGGAEQVLCADARVTSAITDLEAFRAVPLPERLRPLFLELGELGG